MEQPTHVVGSGAKLRQQFGHREHGPVDERHRLQPDARPHPAWREPAPSMYLGTSGGALYLCDQFVSGVLTGDTTTSYLASCLQTTAKVSKVFTLT